MFHQTEYRNPSPGEKKTQNQQKDFAKTVWGTWRIDMYRFKR